MNDGENYIRKNIDNIKEISFTPSSEETKRRDIYKLLTKDGSLDLEFHMFKNFITEFVQKTRKANGIKTVLKKERIGATNYWKTTTTCLTKDNKKISNKYETDTAFDDSGILHKTKVEQKFDKNGNLASQKQTRLDGQNSYLTAEYDNKNRKISQLRTEYTKDGVIKSLTRYSYEYPDKKDAIRTTETVDYEHLIKKITVSSGESFRNLEKEITEYTNPKTGKVTKEVLEKSDVMGVFNVKTIDENGKEHIECLTTKDLFGNVKVEKHLVSLDGTRTEYNYKASKDNNDVELNYQIFDKDGKVLITVDRQFHKISEDKVISSLNGYRHAINYSNDGIIIKDYMTGKTKTVLYNDLLKDEKQIKKENIDFIKRMSADMILNIANKSIKLDILDEMNGSMMIYKNRTLKTQKI